MKTTEIWSLFCWKSQVQMSEPFKRILTTASKIPRREKKTSVIIKTKTCTSCFTHACKWYFFKPKHKNRQLQLNVISWIHNISDLSIACQSICEPQRCRSACASAQSDQRLCCSLLRQYNISRFYSRNFKTPASFCGCGGRFVSGLVGNSQRHVLSCRGSYIIKCIHFDPWFKW